MPINPQAEAYLARGASFGLPHLVDQGVSVARGYSHVEPDLAGALNPRVAIKHEYFTSSTADIPVHIYTPKAPEHKFPTPFNDFYEGPQLNSNQALSLTKEIPMVLQLIFSIRCKRVS